jgi:hypothetical protein
MKAYKFPGWEVIEIESPDEEEYSDYLTRQGFSSSPSMQLGRLESGFYVDVYDTQGTPAGSGISWMSSSGAASAVRFTAKGCPRCCSSSGSSPPSSRRDGRS